MPRATGRANIERLLFCIAISLWFVPGALAKSVWDGVYTSAQADRGLSAYTQYCIRCHKADLIGIEGALKGDQFIERRREDTLETFFLNMKATMPRGNPGGLPEQTYVDIISYVLRANDMPAGSAELKPDELAKIDVFAKGGPQPVPNFATVLSVGCIVQSPEKRWLLTNASEPVRTRDSFQRIESEISASMRRPSSELSFRLADAEDFEATTHAGKKVQVKGVLVRAEAGTRINVNSIEPLAESCP